MAVWRKLSRNVTNSTIQFKQFWEEFFLPWYKNQVDLWTKEEIETVIKIFYIEDFYQLLLHPVVSVYDWYVHR